MNIYGIHDSAIQSFVGAPFFQRTNAAALRMVRDTMQQEQSMFAQHPDDFVLYQLGTYNEETGEIKGEKTLVVRLKDLAQIATETPEA